MTAFAFLLLTLLMALVGGSGACAPKALSVQPNALVPGQEHRHARAARLVATRCFSLFIFFHSSMIAPFGPRVPFAGKGFDESFVASFVGPARATLPCLVWLVR
eukprot:3863377-Rhodomonas_salina.6